MAAPPSSVQTFDFLMREAVALYHEGRFDEAVSPLQTAVRNRPDPALRLMLGHAQMESGRLRAAEKTLRAEVQRDPRSADALHLLGRLFARMGRVTEAAQRFAQALRIDPSRAGIHRDLGFLRFCIGQHAESLVALQTAAALDPTDAVTFNNLGNTLLRLERRDEALRAYERAAALDDAWSLPHRNIAAAHVSAGRHADALRHFEAALTRDPADADALADAGVALLALGRVDEALRRFEAALALDPRHTVALVQSGNALRSTRRFEDAIALHDAAIASDPRNAEAHDQRGVDDTARGEADRAIAHHRRAIVIDPSHAGAHINLGNAFAELNQLDEAAANFDAAIAIGTNRATIALAHWNRSVVDLARGDFARGWRDYEWRWQCAEFPSPRRAFMQPLWLGESDPADKTLLVHAEQGYGDTIQFARLLSPLRSRGARIVFEVQPGLETLFGARFGDDPGVEVVAAGGPPDAARTGYDFHCPLLSLPLALGLRLDSIPAAMPDLRAPAAHVARWAQRLGARPRPRVGIVWSGNQRHTNDLNRSLTPQLLAPLFGSRAVQFVNLQMNAGAVGRALFAGSDWVDVMDEVHDFADTAAVIETLDLVVTVDTAVAHLAGALGKPVWIMLTFAPDFRWLLDRPDSPWYPTARLFRQSRRGDWPGVAAAVAEALRGQFG